MFLADGLLIIRSDLVILFLNFFGATGRSTAFAYR
jgi:hypothetical protein